VHYEGQRIYFRPLEPADELLLRRFINDPHNWQGLHTRGPINECREREWIDQQGKSTTDFVWGIVVRDDDRLIGTTGLHQIDPIARKAEFGINVGDRAFQSKGYGTEAVRLALRYGFEELNLNRLALSVFANNPRAISCYQKVGFQPEGCHRQAAYKNGQYCDVYRFAILRAEWEVIRKR
jgi:RimJ/RimL family protein N-acetyltransferase